MRRTPGYILVETVMAMGLLSVGIVAIQGAMRQAIITQGQARDYTQARFMLDQVIADIELQPQLVEGEDAGSGKGDLSRFKWKSKVSRIDIPQPPIPPNLPPGDAERIKLSAKYLAKIEASVSWERAGRKYKETFETLWVSQKLYVPKEELGP